MSRAIGDASDRPGLSSEPDIVVHEGNWEQDEFIVLATDGLWCRLQSQGAVDFVHSVLASAVNDMKEGKAELGVEVAHKLYVAERLKQSGEHLATELQGEPQQLEGNSLIQVARANMAK